MAAGNATLRALLVLTLASFLLVQDSRERPASSSAASAPATTTASATTHAFPRRPATRSASTSKPEASAARISPTAGCPPMMTVFSAWVWPSLPAVAVRARPSMALRLERLHEGRTWREEWRLGGWTGMIWP
ncbi:hypothetical protein BAE44_0006360 [Dichanthelium oligosanthes]|uniref:Uncharacterized protein n=1 Tax=Dichanthelium oligosanthes TaxID=888268 RepID=A0A1E5W5F2_9POAL|nr:hypothetical protein BAE44_0006360 [Dichanthelium oligosanthes]